MLIFHITVALASIVSAGYMLMRPSKNGLRISYALVIAMFLSGFALLIEKPSYMTQACITGLVYLAFVTFALVSARNKLAGEVQK